MTWCTLHESGMLPQLGACPTVGSPSMFMLVSPGPTLVARDATMSKT